MAYYRKSMKEKKGKPTRGRGRLQMLYDLTRGDGYATLNGAVEDGRDGDTVE